MHKYTANIRNGFTIIEMLIVVGVLGIIAAIVLVAIDPLDQLASANDARRKSQQRELENAVYQYFIDGLTDPGDKDIPIGRGNRMPVCRQGVNDTSCVNLDKLIPEYIVDIPVDVDESNVIWSGYSIYTDAGQWTNIVADYLNGNTPSYVIAEEETTPKSWLAATLVDNEDLGIARNARIVFDGSGNAIAVWRQRGGTYFNAWANYYTAGVGWGTAERIESFAGDVTSINVHMNASGTAFAVFMKTNGTSNIYANRFSSGSWGTEELIESLPGNVSSEAGVQVDSSGNATAVWLQEDGGLINAYANRYNGTNWGTQELIESANNTLSYTPALHVDASGNMLAVWNQNEGLYYNIYTNGSGWNGAIEGISGTNQTSEVKLAMQSNGAKAMAAWMDGNDAHVSTYTAGGGWEAPVRLDTSAGFSQPTDIETDDNDNYSITWEDYDPSWNVSTLSSVYSGAAWGAEEDLDAQADASVQSLAPRIAMDSNGNAIAVWSQGKIIDNNNDIYRIHYTSGSGWGTPEALEVNATAVAGRPDIAFDSNGNAIAIWEQGNDIRAARYE